MLDQITAIKSEIAKLSTVAEAADMHAKVDAIHRYLKAHHTADGILNEVEEARVRLEWCTGRLLKAIERQPGTSPNDGTRYVNTLKEANITKTTAYRWQTIGCVPEERLEQYFAEQRDVPGGQVKSGDVFSMGREYQKEQRGSGRRKQPRFTEEEGARVYFGRPQIGSEEIAGATDALSRPTLTEGGYVKRFEDVFAEHHGGGVAVAVSSCTSALYLCCLSVFEPGDEVVVPALTHVATAHVCSAVGAVPVFADVSIESGNLDLRTLQEAVTAKTKGVILVHYMGIGRDTELIAAFCRDNGLWLIEDRALVCGMVPGVIGDAACFSFYPSKHMTTGEGGMVLTRNADLAESIRARRRFGQKERMGDVDRLGLNFRMTEMQAAMGVEQLKKLPGFLNNRLANANRLSSALSDYKIVCPDALSGYGLTVVVGDSRDKIRHDMKALNVETSIYYPIPVPYMSYYEKASLPHAYPNAAWIAKKSLCLPTGPHVTTNIKYMIEVFRKCAS